VSDGEVGYAFVYGPIGRKRNMQRGSGNDSERRQSVEAGEPHEWPEVKKGLRQKRDAMLL
jgi:hypothetical protein